MYIERDLPLTFCHSLLWHASPLRSLPSKLNAASGSELSGGKGSSPIYLVKIRTLFVFPQHNRWRLAKTSAEGSALQCLHLKCTRI